MGWRLQNFKMLGVCSPETRHVRLIQGAPLARGRSIARVCDPDQQFYENYACGSPRNYTDYCNPEFEKLFDRQSAQSDEGKRKRLVWEIERKLAEDGARPIIFYNRFAYCWQPQVKNWTIMVMVNSIIKQFSAGRRLVGQIAGGLYRSD